MHYELLKVRIIAVIFSLVMIVVILGLIKRRRLDVNYSLIWLLTAISILICSSSQRIIYLLAHLLDIKAPVNLFFIIIVVFIITMLLHFSIVITKLMKQTTKLAQEISLLEERVNRGI